MRGQARKAALGPGLLALLFLASCQDASPPSGDECLRALAIFERCGVTVPVLADTPCTGAIQDLARCVANHARTCDDLAGLTQHIDACVNDELDSGVIVPPAEDLPPPSGPDAASDAGDDGPVETWPDGGAHEGGLDGGLDIDGGSSDGARLDAGGALGWSTPAEGSQWACAT